MSPAAITIIRIAYRAAVCSLSSLNVFIISFGSPGYQTKKIPFKTLSQPRIGIRTIQSFENCHCIARKKRPIIMEKKPAIRTLFLSPVKLFIALINAFGLTSVGRAITKRNTASPRRRSCGVNIGKGLEDYFYSRIIVWCAQV